MPINRAKVDFNSALDEIEAHANFYAVALKLRVRSAKIFSYDRLDPLDVPTVKQFSGSRIGDGEKAFEVLYASICFHFEQFIRDTHRATIDEIVRLHSSIGQIKPALLSGHIVATGQIMARYLSDQRAGKVDVGVYAKNIVSCDPNAQQYRLNSDAFSFFFAGASVSGVEQLFRRIGCEIDWDIFGRDESMKKYFNGGGVREVANLTQKYVDEFVDHRNRIVHRGGYVPASETAVVQAVAFFRLFANILASIANRFCRNYTALAS